MSRQVCRCAILRVCLEGEMNLQFFLIVVFALSSIAEFQSTQPNAPRNGGDFSNSVSAEKVPAGVILVKGAWSSTSDSTTPVPEGGTMLHNVYTNDYFGMSYEVPA